MLSSSKLSQSTIIGSLAAAVGAGAAQSATSQAPAGPRMGGTYAGSNGFKVEFRATAPFSTVAMPMLKGRTTFRILPIVWSSVCAMETLR